MTFVKKASPLGIGTWYIAREKFDEQSDIRVSAKVADEPSETYGIDGGCIIKLEIRIGNNEVAHYDRSWDIKIPEEIQHIYEDILAEFN